MTDELDTYDTAILKAVSANGRITVTDLAERINLSKSPTQTRLRRLEKDGYIRGYTAQLNPVKLGLAHIAFVEVKLDDTREKALKAFNVAVLMLPEIEQCHMIAGKFDYLLKVRTPDMRTYRRILGERVSALPHVAHTSTHVVMEAVKEDAI
ncbi:Lrp/AsnC family transcriptional regulator [Litoreibacter albidus]|uniref:Transcriptional regulator, AsnC family n=1 Tax=Litoreibacter albidus TaxID=670155 RepID=A0A1H2R9Z7_9RHOB|nr:Lrp/AsnC ligand binding domain-containing protein [Litoreibacter albidus]SDW16028.1 transcriptional regulator, AsnC family [Litoreibacter albidus]